MRSSSSRLPVNCFRSIYPKLSLTEFIIERCLGYGKFDVILATTKNKVDDYLIEVAKSYGIKTFRGSEEDKIKMKEKAIPIYEKWEKIFSDSLISKVKSYAA